MELETEVREDYAQWCQGRYGKFWTLLRGCTGEEQMDKENSGLPINAGLPENWLL